MPDNPTSARIERPCIVGGGDVHYPSDDHGRHFEPVGIGRMEDPCGAESGDIGRGNLAQAAVAAAGIVAVVGSPVGGGGLREQIGRADVDVGNNWSLTWLCSLLCFAGNTEQTEGG